MDTADYMFPRTASGQVTWLAIFRLALGLTVEQVAERVQVTTTTLGLWERAVEEPSGAQKRRLGLSMGVPWQRLFYHPVGPQEAVQAVSQAPGLELIRA